MTQIYKPFKNGTKSNRSLHFILQQTCITRAMPHNHSGFGIVSSSSFGNTASNWSASPQSPPQDVSGTKVWVH